MLLLLAYQKKKKKNNNQKKTENIIFNRLIEIFFLLLIYLHFQCFTNAFSKMMSIHHYCLLYRADFFSNYKLFANEENFVNNAIKRISLAIYY